MTGDSTLTAERVREALDYDPLTGVLRWKIRPSNRVHVGDTAGCSSGFGYLTFRLDGTKYQAHRVIWLHVHGAWPTRDLDHRNGVGTDNRLANLREANAAENAQNQHGAQRGSASGFLGVYRNQRGGRWYAKIKAGGRTHYLGTFATAEEASAAYLAAKHRLHPFTEI